MRIYAHRGASAERPENTLSAFQRALDIGCPGIELDVHLTLDSVPVVIHDATLDRTTTGTGDVAMITVADLRALDAGSGERVPTLAEALTLVAGSVHVDIEVKAPAAADAVVSEAARHRDLDWVMSSFDHDVLRHVRSRDAGVQLWPLAVGATDEVIATARDLGSSVIAISEAGIDVDVAEYVSRQGLACWAWTVNDPRRAAVLASWSVFGLCSDDPALLLGHGPVA